MCLLNKNFVYIIVIYWERDDFYFILFYPVTCVNSLRFFVWITKAIYTVTDEANKRNLCINQKFRSHISGRNSDDSLSLASHTKDAIDPIPIEILDKSIRLIRISFLQPINIVLYLITFTLPTLLLVRLLSNSLDLILFETFCKWLLVIR